MPLWNPAVLADYAATPLALLILYFITCALTIGNYVGFFRVNSDVYGNGVTRAYLAFTIVGTANYVLISGVMWIWAAKYSHTTKDRTNKLSYGIYCMLLLKDLPLFIIEYHCILCCGWRQPYQGFVFIVQFITFILSFVFAWLNFVWRMSYILEKYCGEGVHELKTGAEHLVILPPSSSVEEWALDQQRGILQFPQTGSPMRHSSLGPREGSTSFASPLMMQERNSPNHYQPPLHSNPPSSSRRSQQQQLSASQFYDHRFSQPQTPQEMDWGASPNPQYGYHAPSHTDYSRGGSSYHSQPPPQAQYSAPNTPYNRGPASPSTSTRARPVPMQRMQMPEEVQWDSFDSPNSQSPTGRGRSHSQAQDFRSDAPKYVVEEYRYR